MNRIIAGFSALVLCASANAVPIVVDYGVVSTGQSASASFEFTDAATLRIQLAETSASNASALTGGNAILTSLGFALPRVRIAGGSVSLAPGSNLFGFDTSPNLSALWGFTPTNLGDALQSRSNDF